MNCTSLAPDRFSNATYSGIEAIMFPFEAPRFDTDYKPVVGGQIKNVIEMTSCVTGLTRTKDRMSYDFRPKTEFVKKLMVLREQAILNGMKLMTVDEILAEKHALREETY